MTCGWGTKHPAVVWLSQHKAKDFKTVLFVWIGSLKRLKCYRLWFSGCVFFHGYTHHMCSSVKTEWVILLRVCCHIWLCAVVSVPSEMQPSVTFCLPFNFFLLLVCVSAVRSVQQLASSRLVMLMFVLAWLQDDRLDGSVLKWYVGRWWGLLSVF